MGNTPHHDDKQDQKQMPKQAPRPGQGNPSNPQHQPEDGRNKPGQGDDQKRSTQKPSTPAE